MKKCFFTGIFVFYTWFIFSQHKDIKFEQFSVTDGLSNNTVHSIVQDSKGFLWIGTEDGLNRFDGYSFVVYKNNPEDKNSISDNFIYTLFIDKDQNLWIGTNSGDLNKYDRQNNQFVAYSPNKNNKADVWMINEIVQDKNGNLWIGAFGGLYNFDPKLSDFTFALQHSETENSLSSNDIRSLYLENDDILWIGTDNTGIDRYDIKNHIFTNFQNDPGVPSSLSSNSVSVIYRDKSSDLWVGTNKGLNLFNEKSGKFKRFVNNSNNNNSISDNVICDILEDSRSNLWISTRNGLNQLDRAKNLFYNWKSNLSNEHSISDNTAFTIMEDKFGQIWLGCAYLGINKFNSRINKFKHFYHIPKNDNSLSNNTIRDIFEDSNGKFWIGIIDGGLDLYEPTINKFTHFKNNPSNPASISDNRVLTVYEDSKKNIWIGTWDGGLNKAIKKNNTFIFEHYFHNPIDNNSLASNIVQEIIEDKWGRLWIGTSQGLDLFDLEKNWFYHYKHQINNPNSLVENSVQSGCIIFDKNNDLWIGTWGGLSRIKLSEKSHLPEMFETFIQNKSGAYTLSDNRIISLHFDKNYNLWAGTCGGGLNKLIFSDDRNIRKIDHYAEKDGLANNVVYGILEDNAGNLWISTNNGLSEFNPNTESYKNYDTYDGLQSIQFYWGAAYKSKSGEFFFGGINGFNTFFPDSLVSDTILPGIVITDFKIFNLEVSIGKDLKLKKSISETSEIEIDYHDKVISFEFAAIHYAVPSKNKLAYMMEGFDRNWNYTSPKKRFATYTNLDPGEYLFRVKGSNADGNWNNKGVSIKIFIRPPIWQRWWFRVLILFGLSGIIIAIYLFRVYQLKAQKKLLELKVNERTKQLEQANKDLETFAYSISHDLRAPVRHIDGFMKLLYAAIQNPTDQVTSYYKKIIYSTKNMSQMIDDLLEFSRLGRKEIVRQIVDIDLIITEVIELHKPDIGIRNIQWILNPIGKVTGDRNLLKLAFNNLISNAIKYTSKKEKTIIEIGKTRSKNNKFEIFIKDNGVGFDMSNVSKLFGVFQRLHSLENFEGTGIGLANVKQIINKHNGQIRAEAKVNEGAIFYIELPGL